MNLQVETIRSDCDKARREVEASDAEISGMEQEEERLKLQYVESTPVGLKTWALQLVAPLAWREREA